MKSVLLLLGLCIAVQAKTSKRQKVPVVVPGSSAGLTPDKRLVCKLDFNRTQGNVVEDGSGYANNGYLMAGAILVNFQVGKCGNGAFTYCGDILFHGDTFQAKPYVAVTVAAWINLKDTTGRHSIFDTIGRTHATGQYHFEVNDGRIRWFHRNESQTTIFETHADGDLVKKDTWTHILGNYDSATGKSKIYVNGVIRNMTEGAVGAVLSRDWMSRAGIGDHKANRPLMGYIDDFRIYNYALTKKEIKTLASQCDLKPKPKPPAKKPFFADTNVDSLYDNAPIDAASPADNYLPLKKEVANRQNNLDSIEEAVLKRSKMGH